MEFRHDFSKTAGASLQISYLAERADNNDY